MMQGDKMQVAAAWLAMGAALLPLQPGSKRIITGFGPYLQRIQDDDAARFWFLERDCNLALVCGGGFVVLDFDQVTQYAAWRELYPEAAQTYTEQTRRGFHAFFVGKSDSYSYQGDGFEVKGKGGFVVLSPSVVGGFRYAALDDGAALLQLPAALSLLSESSPPGTLSREKGIDTIARIKAAYSVRDIVSGLTLLRSRDQRWYHGSCPITDHAANHDGRRPFWIDSKRGLWGCYACGLRGDVVNLYAVLHGLSVDQAIKAMAARL